MKKLAVGFIRLYQRWLSPLKPPTCRFLPTCSSYAIEAIERHGIITGSWYASCRICRCHPWGGHGYDPVPPKRDSKNTDQLGNDKIEK